ncbi:MAG: hypothetical protein ABI240_12355 [Sphingomonas sp.]
MSGVFAAIIIVRIVWWLVRSDVIRSQPKPIETAPPPRESGFPQRPQLGGYGITPPESDA